jgi:hypothetical protein
MDRGGVEIMTTRCQGNAITHTIKTVRLLQHETTKLIFRNSFLIQF